MLAQAPNEGDLSVRMRMILGSSHSSAIVLNQKMIVKTTMATMGTTIVAAVPA